MYKVGITGSRHWQPRDMMYRILDKLYSEHPDMYLIVGDATGVDAIAREWARLRDCPFKEYKANWFVGSSAGPQRNHRMVDENPDTKVWLAFPLPSSRGTYDCIRKAEAAGIDVKVIPFV